MLNTFVLQRPSKPLKIIKTENYQIVYYVKASYKILYIVQITILFSLF